MRRLTWLRQPRGRTAAAVTLLVASLLSATAVPGAAGGDARPEKRARSAPAAVGTISVALGRPLNRFRPDQALGAGVDGHQAGDTGLIYTPANLAAMRSAGLSPLSYRLRTELAVEAWHWNGQGSWSDPVHRRGYWTGSDQAGPGTLATYGYRLPRRGDTIDQANDDGYSRLDDGRLSTFWKSDPYLDPRFTHEPDRAHPQWVLIAFARPEAVDAVRLAWGWPYARKLRVEYFVGTDALQFANDPRGYWRPFSRSRFAGHPGTQTLRVAASPVHVSYLRVLMQGSSHTAPPGSRDVRDRLGFAVRELWAGSLEHGHLRDAIKHVPDGRQTVTYVSSTDPWHRAIDRDPDVEQPSFQTVAHSGLMKGQPLLTPVPTLYGTPDDAAAELRYLRSLGVPVRRLELGEEPDGQLVTPEDYGSLYAQFAHRLHEVDPQIALGGPGYQTSIPDWESWPWHRGGDVSWTRRFLRELRRLRSLRELSFFSFEWYPFDNGCLPAAPQLARAPQLLTRVLAEQRAEGLPSSLPRLITEYGYSAFATRSMVAMPGALLNADTVGRFLADGGSAAYLYGYEPDSLIRELSCRTWGNLILFLADDSHRIRQPVATYWGARLLTRVWAQPGDGLHTMLATVLREAAAGTAPAVSGYAVRRPDGRVAVMLINKDPRRSWTFRLSLRAGGRSRSPRGTAEVFSYSSSQYRWHAAADHGYARPDRPPVRVLRAAHLAYTLPPMSLTVVRLVP